LRNESWRKDIRSIARDRDVRLLFHFTQIANLAGIVEHGLSCRRVLAGPEYLAYASSKYRIDGNDGAVSVSISRLNRWMFNKKRKDSGHRDWVVLGLRPDILWTHDCRFCWRNAGHDKIKDHRGFRGGPWAFTRMFAGDDEARRDLPPSCPTDPEAEVQVLERIAPELIVGAIVDRPTTVARVSALLSGLPGDQRLVDVEAF
jgi:hypothetical protein